jgi:hypothetical protein
LNQRAYLIFKEEAVLQRRWRAAVKRSAILALFFWSAIAVGFAAGSDGSAEGPAFFTLVLLPDTQLYSKSYPQVYDKQARWIVAHRDQMNIKMAIHLGDITHNNTHAQWAVADKAHEILDKAGISYSVIPGNHDMPKSGDGRLRDTSIYNHYFGPHRFAGKKWYGGHKGSDNDNNYVFFEHGALKFMVVGLEFAPRKEALKWAGDLIRQHHDRRVIVVTHCYQAKSLAGEDKNGEHQTNCAANYGLEGFGGDTIWEALVSRHKNIFLVLSGHIADVEHYVRKGRAGNRVHEILTDYQKERPGGDPETTKSGNGWLRTLKFVPNENKVYVRSHSVEGETRFYMTRRYNEDPQHSDHSYSFEYEMGSFGK